MKNLILLALSIMVSSAIYGHEAVTTTVVSKDTLYYDYQMKSVNNAESASYYRLLAKERTSKTQRDVFQDYYMNGKLRAQGGFNFLDLSNDKNTVLDGDVTTYYPNGSMKWRCNYVNGKREGYFTLLMHDGSIGVIDYQNGEPKYDYISITHKDGTVTQKSLGHYRNLIQ